MSDPVHTLTDAQIDALVALVRQTGRDLVMPRFRNLDPGDIDAKSDAMDLVTIADREAEAALASGARAILPGCAVVGEEAVAEDRALLDQIATAETCVLIDPVDGTFNFARGLAVFGIILAVTHRGQTIFGLLYDPVLDDWVMAQRGGGAYFCNARGMRRPIATRAGRPLAETEGTIPLDLVAGDHRAKVLDAIAAARSARSLRCSCHEYRMLATGQADFAVNTSSNPWDHAAGALIVAEAGGAAILTDGTPYSPLRHHDWVIASGTPALAQTLHALNWPGRARP